MAAIKQARRTRDELSNNLVNLVGQCDRDTQEHMLSHLSPCDEEYGRRVAEGLGIQTIEKPTTESAGAR
jgi:catalase